MSDETGYVPKDPAQELAERVAKKWHPEEAVPDLRSRLATLIASELRAEGWHQGDAGSF